jgi:hypothetical protein
VSKEHREKIISSSDLCWSWGREERLPLKAYASVPHQVPWTLRCEKLYVQKDLTNINKGKESTVLRNIIKGIVLYIYVLML